MHNSLQAFMRLAVLAAVFTLPATSACASPGEKLREPLPFELATSLRSFNYGSTFSLSPDGLWVSYTYLTNEAIPADYYARYTATGVPRFYPAVRVQASLANSKTLESIQLGDGKSMSWGPVWSPDNKRVAYFSDFGGEAGLWIWEKASKKTRRIPGVIVRPFQSSEVVRWMNDSQHLVLKILPAGMTIEQANALFPSRDRYASGGGELTFKKVGPDEASVMVMTAHAKADKGETKKSDPRYQEENTAIVADLAVVNIANDEVTRVTEKASVRWYEPSPDGKYIAYTTWKSSDSETYQQTYDLILCATTDSSCRATGSDLRLSYYGNGWNWSPDSKYIAYYNAGVRPPKSQESKEPVPKGEIVVVAVSDNSSRSLGTAGMTAVSSTDPLWSADSRSLYILGTDAEPSKADNNPVPVPSKLWRVNVESGHGALIAGISDQSISSIIKPSLSSVAWTSNNGQELWVLAYKMENQSRQQLGSLYNINLNTGASKKALELTTGWSASFDVSSNTGEIAYSSSDVQRAADIWLFNTRNGRKRQATRLNKELDQYELGTAQLIDWYGIDGEELHGALMLPPGYQKGQRVPLVVFVFGWGQESQYVNQFGFMGNQSSYNMHVLATRGYAVLFADTIMQKGTQMKDLMNSVMPGVNTAIQQGYADPDRLAVMGYSLGSYCVLALVSQTQRFKAAVISGSNVHPDIFGGYLLAGDLKAEANPDQQREAGKLAMGGTPWEQRDRYINNSPIYFFDRIQTPLLIIQGEKDPPLSPVRAMYSALKRLNKEAEVRVYENDDHAISRRPNVIDFWKRRIEFIDKYLDISRDEKGRMIFEGNQAKSSKKPDSATSDMGKSQPVAQ